MSEPERRAIPIHHHLAIPGECHALDEMTYLCLELRERQGSGYHIVIDVEQREVRGLCVISSTVCDCDVIWLSGE